MGLSSHICDVGGWSGCPCGSKGHGVQIRKAGLAGGGEEDPGGSSDCSVLTMPLRLQPYFVRGTAVLAPPERALCPLQGGVSSFCCERSPREGDAGPQGSWCPGVGVERLISSRPPCSGSLTLRARARTHTRTHTHTPPAEVAPTQSWSPLGTSEAGVARCSERIPKCGWSGRSEQGTTLAVHQPPQQGP